MSNILNKMWLCYYDKDKNQYNFEYPFADRGYGGDLIGISRTIVKKYPSFALQIRTLLPLNIFFFYDPVNKNIRFMAKKDLTVNDISKLLIEYTKNILLPVKEINKFCYENNISNFILSTDQIVAAKQIVDFLDEKEIDIEVLS